MTFAELQQKVQLIEKGEPFEFDLSWIDPKLTLDLDDFVKIPDNIIKLHETALKIADAKSITITGELRIKGIFNKNTFFVVSLTIFNSIDLDYFVTVEPKGKWLDDVDSNLRNIIKNIPLSIGDTLFVYSSINLAEAAIAFQDQRLYKMPVSKGQGIVTHVKSKLLELVKLSDTVFTIDRSADGLYRIFKEMKFTVDFAGLLKVETRKLNFINKDNLTIDGTVTLPFPGQPLSIDCVFGVSEKSYQAKVAVDNNIQFPFQNALLKGLNIGNIELELQGSFVSPGYYYGVKADYAIAEPIKPRQLNADMSTLQDGQIHILYNSTTQGTLIPSFVQAYAKEITLGKVISLFTGKKTALPGFLDPIKLYSTYIYFCEDAGGQLLVNGVTAKKGIALSSGIRILGLDAYCEYSALEQRTKGDIFVEPIDLSGLVKIGGNGTGTPVKYTGPKIPAGGMNLTFDSEGPEYVKTDLSVRLFNIFDGIVSAKLEENGLKFIPEVDLGFVKTKMECLLKDITQFQLASQFHYTVAGLKADFGDLGKLNLNLAVDCKLSFGITSKNPDAKAAVHVGFSFNGATHSLTIPVSVHDLKSLEDTIRKEVTAFLQTLITSALQWLKAILDKAIQLAEDALQEATKIGENLSKAFNQGIDQGAKLLNDAGYQAERAGRILQKGMKATATEAASAMRKAGYAAKDVGNVLKNIYGVAADGVAGILKAAGYVPTEVGNILKDAYAVTDSTIEGLLKAAGYVADEVEKVLTVVYKKPAKAAEKAVADVGKEAGKAAKNTGKEIKKGYKKLKKRLGF